MWELNSHLIKRSWVQFLLPPNFLKWTCCSKKCEISANKEKRGNIVYHSSAALKGLTWLYVLRTTKLSSDLRKMQLWKGSTFAKKIIFSFIFCQFFGRWRKLKDGSIFSFNRFYFIQRWAEFFLQHRSDLQPSTLRPPSPFVSEWVTCFYQDRCGEH